MRARSDRMQTPRIAFSDLNAERTLDRLPSVKLDHLYRMTDHTGLLQHAVFTVPNYREGYATDDNARAFIVAVLMEQLGMTACVRVGEVGILLSGISVARVQSGDRPISKLSELRAPVARSRGL